MKHLSNNHPANHVKKLALVTGLWLVTMALASFGPELIWENKTLFTISAIAINLGAGLLMVFTNVQYWNSLDEMMQRVQLNAMGLALGLGIVGGLSFSMLESSDIIQFGNDISFMVALMSITYLTSIVIGLRRLQ